MDYHRHYQRLMDRARDRKIQGYSERHHIVPKCLGGPDEAGNIVRLTPEEHYVAHQLLVKMHPGDKSLVWAAMNMTGANKRQAGRQNKIYGWLRRKFAEVVGRTWTGRRHSAEARAKMSRTRTGLKRTPHTAETKAKMSAASKGRKKSLMHRLAMSAERMGKKRGPQSEEHRRKIAEGNKRTWDSGARSRSRSQAFKVGQSHKMREVWEKRRQGILPMPNL